MRWGRLRGRDWCWRTIGGKDGAGRGRRKDRVRPAGRGWQAGRREPGAAIGAGSRHRGTAGARRSRADGASGQAEVQRAPVVP